MFYNRLILCNSNLVSIAQFIMTREVLPLCISKIQICCCIVSHKSSLLQNQVTLVELTMVGPERVTVVCRPQQTWVMLSSVNWPMLNPLLQKVAKLYRFYLSAINYMYKQQNSPLTVESVFTDVKEILWQARFSHTQKDTHAQIHACSLTHIHSMLHRLTSL